MPARPLENERMVRTLPSALKNGTPDSAIQSAGSAFAVRVASSWQASPFPERATPSATGASATTAPQFEPAKRGMSEPACEFCTSLKLAMKISDRRRNFCQHIARTSVSVRVRRERIGLRRKAGEIRSGGLCPGRIRSHGCVDAVSKPKEVACHLRIEPPTATSERDRSMIETVLNRLMQSLQLFVLQRRWKVTEHAIAGV